MTRAAHMPPAIEEPWPVIVLARPQMGENIGACARAMLNFGLVGLRLVDPRDRWPNPKAYPAASGADRVLDRARVEWSLEAALADCTYVLAATARPREQEKPVLGPREAAQRVRALVAAGERPAVLFGPEADGLTGEDVARADAIVTYPVNPGFASLNLAQAVLVFAHTYREERDGPDAPAWFRAERSAPASQQDLEGFFAHLDAELVRGRFFHPPEKAALVRQHLRAPFLRAGLTEQEVRTLRGVIRALTTGRGGRKLPE
jgi:tRNA/rRNA methyltransferase